MRKCRSRERSIGKEAIITAGVFLWNGNYDAVSMDHWDLGTFIREHLDDWIELFAGMELVGMDSSGLSS